MAEVDTKSPSQRKLTKIMAIIILILLAITTGSVWYALKERQAGSERTEVPASNEGANVATSEDENDRRPADPIQTVQTDNPYLELQLDSVVRRDNNVVINLSFTYN